MVLCLEHHDANLRPTFSKALGRNFVNIEMSTEMFDYHQTHVSFSIFETQHKHSFLAVTSVTAWLPPTVGEGNRIITA